MSDKIISGITARHERRLLNWLAGRLPDWTTPDMMTGIGVVGGALTFVGYGLASYGVAWLLVACLGLVLHWFGDSLDGTLARFRRIERNKYGMFLDQTVDVFTVSLIFLGLGLSPWVRFEIACLFLIGYLMLVALTHLRGHVTGIYDVAYGHIGPTEGRLFLLAVTCVMMVVPPFPMTTWPVPMTSFDHVILGMAVWTLCAYVLGSLKVLKQLAVAEPRIDRRRSR